MTVHAIFLIHRTALGDLVRFGLAGCQNFSHVILSRHNIAVKLAALFPMPRWRRCVDRRKNG